MMRQFKMGWKGLQFRLGKVLLGRGHRFMFMCRCVFN